MANWMRHVHDMCHAQVRGRGKLSSFSGRRQIRRKAMSNRECTAKMKSRREWNILGRGVPWNDPFATDDNYDSLCECNYSWVKLAINCLSSNCWIIKSDILLVQLTAMIKREMGDVLLFTLSWILTTTTVLSLKKL